MPDTAESLLNRRRFLSLLSLGLGALAALVLSVPVLAYLLSPLLDPNRNVWRNLGSVDQFKVGDTVKVDFEEPSPLPWSGQTAQAALWLRRDDATHFTAFAVNCAHLGCPVDWRPDAKLFLCPCHGGVYYADGSVAGGPPPRPLFRYDTRVENGTVEILTRPLPVG
ncbi:MAG TPA: Rieske (2Fe-2S) protein [Chloroflexota bacterium]|nr:Rieske (2Fe-2S) protein [Chloroflexota bacterium]